MLDSWHRFSKLTCPLQRSTFLYAENAECISGVPAHPNDGDVIREFKEGANQCTKSTITREESVQAAFDLKIGYRLLSFSRLGDSHREWVRMALAANGQRRARLELPLDHL